MSETSPNKDFRLGFLTTVEVAEKGYVGGLLITNQHGRPLEFQCTTPVKPNRTQEILYGPTLRPFVLGELIGGTLVEKVGVKPDLILTEQSELLDLRNCVSVPVACLEERSESDLKPPKSTESSDVADDPDGPDGPNSDRRSKAPVEDERLIRLGRQRLRFHTAHTEDRRTVSDKADRIPPHADLSEPFQRVREALDETMR